MLRAKGVPDATAYFVGGLFLSKYFSLQLKRTEAALFTTDEYHKNGCGADKPMTLTRAHDQQILVSWGRDSPKRTSPSCTLRPKL